MSNRYAILKVCSRASDLYAQHKWQERGQDAMHVVSVSVRTVQPIQQGKPSGQTGIYKMPRADSVRVTTLGLEHDAIVDTENHGGRDLAVYVFMVRSQYAEMAAVRGVVPQTAARPNHDEACGRNPV